ncbi:MAG: DEAD/DEAH box helicase [Bdellovibrionota bacterium]
MSAHLEALGRMLQYLFEDGTILNGNQILYHSYSREVARHLLPLSVNVKADLQDGPQYILDTSVPSGKNAGYRPTWQTQAERVILSVLMAAIRSMRHVKSGEDDGRGPEAVYMSFDDHVDVERQALSLESIDLLSPEWGPWRLTTALPHPVSGVHYGRARLELDPTRVPDAAGLSRAFIADVAGRKLSFHPWDDQLHRLQLRAPKPNAGEPVVAETHAKLEPSDASQSVGVHMSGHSTIQAAHAEFSEMLKESGAVLPIHPGSFVINADKIKPRLAITGDGSFRFQTKLETPWGAFEAHGLPQASAYLLLNLQLGLGATTGYANAHLAHARRGIKRERDMKVLRNLGFSALIFYDAANYALGLPLSDGSQAKSIKEVCESLYQRIGNLVLKTEGWPVQAGSLSDLCSSNVTTLIEGFVSQIARDTGREGDETSGREVHVYLPEGELRVRGLARAIVQLFHGFVADLAAETKGTCFGRARTKYFENFMNSRGSIEREDIVLREEVDPAIAARFIYQPGIGERYLLPESSIPPRGMNVFSLLTEGFDLTIDGKVIEEFEASDFRPEFDLRETDDIDDDTGVIPLGHQKINWFELSPKFFFKGVEISGEQASRLSKEGMLEFDGKLFRVKSSDLPSLKRLTQFWASIQSKNANLMRSKRRKTEDTYYQLPRSQTLELLALRASGVKVRGGARWDEVTKFYDSLERERELIAIPDTFKTQLQPYQHSAVQWLRDLRELGLGGILADDMGLGKTVTSLAFLETLRVKEKMGKVLILVPTSLTYNWLSEAERFVPDMPVSIFSSREPEKMLDFIQSNRESAVICTYGLLQENSQLFEQVEWDTIIFDEAQNLKNITTKRTTSARKLRGFFKLCLTGTPLENHYGEFYSLFDLIVPGSLGELPDFREKYVNPVRVLREDIDYLKLKARPLLMRRTKAQVMSQLPPKIETTMKLPFEEEQKRIYRDIATAYNEQIRSQIAMHGESKMQLQMLTALLRLRQACSDPAAIPGVRYQGEPPKITTLVEALGEVTEGGASALVFTQFLATFERIRQSLAAEKIPFYDISGADSRLSREKKLRAFNEDGKGSVMLMTLKTGGVGLNLVKASYVFHIEPWWNPAVENQATDRAHRIGQSSTVQVVRYIIKESVEEKIEVLKDVKAKRFDALFSVSEKETDLGPAGTTLTQRDFEFLLS